MPRFDSRVLLLGAVLVSTAACGDSRLSHLSTGIDRDSVAVVMGGEAPHRSESYLLDGKFWEIFYYAKRGVAQGDSVAWRKLSPVVLADGKLAGWGWSYWEKEAEHLRIPVPAAE